MASDCALRHIYSDGSSSPSSLSGSLYLTPTAAWIAGHFKQSLLHSRSIGIVLLPSLPRVRDLQRWSRLLYTDISCLVRLFWPGTPLLHSWTSKRPMALQLVVSQSLGPPYNPPSAPRSSLFARRWLLPWPANSVQLAELKSHEGTSAAHSDHSEPE